MRTLSAIVLLLAAHYSQAQTLPGFSTSKAAGVTAVLSNPASLAQSCYAGDINVLTIRAGVSNDSAHVKMSDFAHLYRADSLVGIALRDQKEWFTGVLFSDVLGPSAMFKVGNKLTMAVSTRSRTYDNMINMNSRLMQSALVRNTVFDLPDYSFNSSSPTQVVIGSWMDLGISGAYPVFQSGKHKLSLGATVKYLMGVANWSLKMQGVNGLLYQEEVQRYDMYAWLPKTTVDINTSGEPVGKIDLFNIDKITGTGWGADLGISYLFDDPHHRVSLGFSALDLGHMRYERNATQSGTYSTDRGVFFMNRLLKKRIGQYGAELSADGIAETAVGAPGYYTTGLPSRFLLEADGQVHGNFSINLTAQIARPAYNDLSPVIYNCYTLTPRFENKNWSVFLPMTIDELSQFNAGFAFRAGPLFLGSGSLFTSLLGRGKQADVYGGLKFLLNKS